MSPSSQLDAVVKLRHKLAQRHWIATSVTRYSPPLFMIVLILGYIHSSEFDVPTEYHSNVTMNMMFTGPHGVRAELLNMKGLSTMQPLLSGPLPIVPIENYLDLGTYARNSLNESQVMEFGGAIAGSFGPAISLGTLHLAPDTEFTRELAAHMVALDSVINKSVPLRLHPDEETALAYIDETRLTNRTWALLHFRQLGGKAVDYSIRCDNFALPPTQEVIRKQTIGLNMEYSQYHTSGFLSIQKMVDDFLFERASRTGAARPASRPPASTGLLLTPFPTAGFHFVQFYASHAGGELSLVLTMSLLAPISLLVKSIVHEKERRLAFAMRMAGLRPRAHLLGWLRSALFEFTIVAVLLTMTTAFVMRLTSPLVLLLVLLAFCYGAAAFAFLISTLFNHGVLAACAGPVAFLAAVLPHYLFLKFNPLDAEPTENLYVTLSLPASFGFAADQLVANERNVVGITFSQFVFDESGDDLRFWLKQMIIDGVLYVLLGLYLEHTWPLQYGRREPPHFFLLPSYWVEGKRLDPRRHLPARNGRKETLDASAHEEVGADVASRECVEIGGLVKAYGSAAERKLAVDDLDLTFYSGQISCLLGHNGAGKTTTLSVLTGLLTPTEGDCVVFDRSVRDEPSRCHEVLGLCPQHDVLWPLLTVRDHLELYAALKGVPASHVESEAERMASEVGLVDKLDTQSSQLSGGMQRKLSMGCALTGSAKLVVLDEPSSGLDPVSRTHLWELLRTYRDGRAIVLTTHYMDEADLLADRIAILSAGKLITSGSSIFLKNRCTRAAPNRLYTPTPLCHRRA